MIQAGAWRRLESGRHASVGFDAPLSANGEHGHGGKRGLNPRATPRGVGRSIRLLTATEGKPARRGRCFENRWDHFGWASSALSSALSALRRFRSATGAGLHGMTRGSTEKRCAAREPAERAMKRPHARRSPLESPAKGAEGALGVPSGHLAPPKPVIVRQTETPAIEC